MDWENVPVELDVRDVDLEQGPLLVVSCYTHHSELAHQPKGSEAPYALYVFGLDTFDGSLTLLHVVRGPKNLAFTRFHPEKAVFYSCTESLMENGKVMTFALDMATGKATEIGCQDAGGTSTCYLTFASQGKFMLVVNYWSSSVVCLPINGEDGALGEICNKFHPLGIETELKVQAGRHIAHSKNDPEAQRQRQLDPHAHAIVMDPFIGCIAYVPDLGMDVIHELFFDREKGKVHRVGKIPAGVKGKVHGPRYIEFHQKLEVCYVINEISSQVAVYRVNRQAISDLAAANGQVDVLEDGCHTLIPIQCISTIPEAFDPMINTCGRITCHPNGRYVIVSNRGHNSLVVFRIKDKRGGRLSLVGWTHTRGATPRHFQFDSTGQWLIVANQDSDTLAVFQFNLASGRLTPGGVYSVPSPNFVACCPLEKD